MFGLYQWGHSDRVQYLTFIYMNPVTGRTAVYSRDGHHYRILGGKHSAAPSGAFRNRPLYRRAGKKK